MGSGGVVRAGAAGEGGMRGVSAGVAAAAEAWFPAPDSRDARALAGRGSARRVRDGRDTGGAGGVAVADHAMALLSRAGSGDSALSAITGSAVRVHGRSGYSR